MIRQIIHIDEEKCTGCGLCAKACHEAAIEIIDGKARLVRDDYCDGMGDCLPACPVDAISFEEREAAPYDEAAVEANLQTRAREQLSQESALSNWPVQIKLAPTQAPYFNSCKLLVAADCCAYAYASFHRDYMRGKVTLIGCPKLDGIDYAEKLTEILVLNDIEDITIARMEVPCCGGLESAVKRALQASSKSISLQTVTFSLDGKVLA